MRNALSQNKEETRKIRQELAEFKVKQAQIQQRQSELGGLFESVKRLSLCDGERSNVRREKCANALDIQQTTARLVSARNETGRLKERLEAYEKDFNQLPSYEEATRGRTTAAAAGAMTHIQRGGQ
ncbi:hypothetical protein [Martelella sp. HB161492]|uniref:hypothetical protein n=1 Tax=Martelella sp. HB161492 TaxID=2720726 RepID=UPI00158FB320|nr:hypothetical protein [Martelella sp. HB161492]